MLKSAQVAFAAFAAIIVAVATFISGGPAMAASVVIWPVDPTIKKGERATGVWVENTGAVPINVQVRAFGWSQPQGETLLADQDEVVASPPIATVHAGQRQLIRIIRRTPGAGPDEGSYRLMIDELPAPRDADKPEGTAASLGVLMRYSIPLFTYNIDTAGLKPQLKARVVETSGDKALLELANAGDKHARLVDLRATGDGASLTPGLVGYVLPGQSLRVTVPKAAAASSSFTVNVNGADQSLAPAV